MATYLVVIKYDAHMIVIDGFIIFIAIWHKFDKLSHDRIFFLLIATRKGVNLKTSTTHIFN